MTIIAWTYDLMLRTKDSVGAAVHYFIAYDGTVNPPVQPVACGPITPSEKIELEREGLDYSMDPQLVGVRYKLPVVWDARGATIPGSSTRTIAGSGTRLTTLGALLQDLFTAGIYLEVSVNGGTTWRACYIESQIDFKSRSGKNLAVGLEIVFAQKMPRTVLAGVAAADW